MNHVTPSIAAVLLATAIPLGAQPTPLSEEPSCSSCRITYEAAAVLGDLDDPASPGQTAEVARLSDGRIAVSSPTMGPQVLLYEPDGTFVRSIGREGQGPGELLAAPFVHAVEGGNLALLDPRQGVIHRMDPQGALLGTVRFDLRTLAFASHPRGWVLSGPRTTEDGTTALHLVDDDGEVRVSFAPTTTTNMRALVRQVTVAADGSVWAAPMSGGGLERWSSEGELLAEYRIQNEDLQREAPAQRMPAGERRPAQVADLSIDGNGRVWVWIAVPDPDFEPGRDGGGRTPEDVYDTRVLVFDPEVGTVEVRDQFDVLVRPLGEGWAFDVVETELGDRKVRIGRIALGDLP